MDNKINWTPPELPAEIPQGDMPGDRVKIYEDAVEKANLLFPKRSRGLPAITSVMIFR